MIRLTMKYLCVSLALANAVFGGKILVDTDGNSELSQNYGQIANNGISSENARIFSQEEPMFPARYYYPTYPEYVDLRYQNAHNGPIIKVPIQPEHPISTWSAAWTKLIPISSFALLYGAKAGILIFSVLLILILGLIFTTTICTFTPICTISFPGLALTKNQIKEQVAELARNYITPESLNAATVLVQEAVDKYTKVQSEEDKKETTTFQPSSTVKSTTSTVKPTTSPIQIPSTTNESTSTTESTVLV